MAEGKCWRITIITERLLRLEYQREGLFEDRPSFLALDRHFADPAFTERRDGEKYELETDALVLRYDGNVFSSAGLSILVKETGCTWHFGEGNHTNFFGTARTLDMTDGFAPLEPGIFGRDGYGVLDDSGTPVFSGEELLPRQVRETDLYFFGYGRDFLGGLKDFSKLSGTTPLIPRYALGNWWSRYWRYTEESYLKLLSDMEKENIPLSVAVIDMDWHLTEVDPKYGSGWTGFTWNEELFPDYKRFLKKLGEKHLAVTLNLHPAEGIRAFEAMYPQASQRMGMDPEAEEPIEFNMQDPRFRETYFEEVLRPYEEDGVNFWWIDWQQGTGEEGGIDPLILLNHYHYRDQEERGKRPMIFSRYAGPGSHRLPVGFSGDTVTTWRSLDYQPYFTANASNIAYGWWSHDIGGHMMGDRNDERLIRWIQFGVFSPIMRIHSSNSPFFNKEPWTLAEPYRRIMGDFMRLRHALVPYLYTSMRETSETGMPLVQPVYYRYPECREAYEVPNEYFFGPSLLVLPITRESSEELRLGSVSGWLPEGRYTDFFTGHVYKTSGKHRFFRTLDSLPVLLREGGITVLSEDASAGGTEVPKALRVIAGAGESGSYTLYEDDGATMAFRDGAFAETEVTFAWERFEDGMCACTFAVAPVRGDGSQVPEVREITFAAAGAAPGTGMRAFAGEESGSESVPVFRCEKTGFVQAGPVSVRAASGIRVRIEGIKLAENDREKEIFAVLDRAWTTTAAKEEIFREWKERESDAAFLERLSGLDVSEELKEAVRESFL